MERCKKSFRMRFVKATSLCNYYSTFCRSTTDFSHCCTRSSLFQTELLIPCISECNVTQTVNINISR
jgi:hypothetical protein